ncbi:MAG: hypothetical protein ABIF77_22280 [bacterium]
MNHRSVLIGTRPGSAFFVVMVLLTATLVSVDATAQSPEIFPRLGLSAAPDEYVSSLEIDAEESFTLYIILSGPNHGAIQFEFSTVSWLLHVACCADIARILDVEYPAGMQHEGNPLAGVNCTLPACQTGDVLLLATVTFQLYRPVGGFYFMSAGIAEALYDCAEEFQIVTEGSVTVMASTSQTPAGNPTWGQLKLMYK